MLECCNNCGGRIEFEPRIKGNRCQSCGSVFPIEYDYSFNKNPFTKNLTPQSGKLLDVKHTYKCSSCGASMVLGKFSMQSKCPYCGMTEIVQSKFDDIPEINSIVPFAFSKDEIFKHLKTKVNKSFFVNKKIFRSLALSDFNGIYINAFIFDVDTKSIYTGTFNKSVKNKQDEIELKRVFVAGEFDKSYKNITIEANSKLTQHEMVEILPYDYSKAVAFKEDFLCGYILEYQDRMLEECFQSAENYIKRNIRDSLLEKHKCDSIEMLNISTHYPYKRYNYCLLPVYFVNVKDKKTTHRILINGQNGKISRLPKNGWKIFWLIFLISTGLLAAILPFIFM